jgi:hypothetical protein
MEKSMKIKNTLSNHNKHLKNYKDNYQKRKKEATIDKKPS